MREGDRDQMREGDRDHDRNRDQDRYIVHYVGRSFPEFFIYFMRYCTEITQLIAGSLFYFNLTLCSIAPN